MCKTEELIRQLNDQGYSVEIRLDDQPFSWFIVSLHTYDETGGRMETGFTATYTTLLGALKLVSSDVSAAERVAESEASKNEY